MRFFVDISLLLVVFLGKIGIVFGRPSPVNSTTASSENDGPVPRGFFGPDQTIVFPDSTEVVFEPVSRIRGPPTCAGDSTFCEDFEAYPYNQVQKVIENNDALKPLFGEDESPPDEITNRLGLEDEDQFLCKSSTRTIYPQLGKTGENKWKIIVNQGKDGEYVQGVRIEMCKIPEGPCDVFGNLLTDITARCVQKYMYRKLLAFEGNNTPSYETFRLPSACCCAYRVNTKARFLSQFEGKLGVTPAVRKKRRR